MAAFLPPVPMDRASESLWRGRGKDPRDLEALIGRILSYIHLVLPGPPASRHAPGLYALLPHDHLDRLSLLPDALLRNVLTRLSVTDAARTTALSRRWRGLWRSAPLVLVDAHLLPSSPSPEVQVQVPRDAARCVTSAVSRILAAHPGPFRCVHLTTSHMEEFRGLLARWLQLLAVKGIQELVLANRPWPFDLDLPAAFFGMATLTRLYLAFWKFPDTAGLPRASSFPNLRELGLCTVAMESRHMNFIISRSPVLEILCIQANLLMDRLTLVSRSIRCVQLIGASDLEIVVDEAPKLERLIIWESFTRKGPGSHKRIKIGHAPALSILGYLEPELHTLQIGNTTIKTGTKASPSTMVPTVKILGLKVRFGVRNEAKILPCFFRCFPNVERLHIESKKTAETTGKLNLKFWEESGAIECIRSHVDLMIFQNFLGDRCELSFLKFFLENARMLTKLAIVCVNGSFSSLAEVNAKVKPLFDTKWASNCCQLLLFESAFAEGQGLQMQNFERGSDFSVRDPFAVIVRA
ncbi:hypothetical protein VPH35_072351 [Triticum aestivum]|uniref:F-box domain-containing protein n=1 Tax=Triticum turgidum subsp. durum TaxID=4567 RepID=A0A9R0T380_TRITD|nr:F-box/FBD/LRR-repeat protein At1g13570-like [Triticum aestivum]VAI03734.1 unnamed protein product [Triticum turgidum subsp. durum]